MNIQATEQNIDRMFAGTTYYIDFYQRQYKWSGEPVIRLLDDVFYTFDEGYKKHKDSELPLQEVVDKYPWYYLNTYVTNCVGTKTYVVDGQQRLTTLTLILIKLKHLAMRPGFEHFVGMLENHIVGHTGDFRMNHEAHPDTMKGLLELDGKPLSDINTDSGITAKNMVGNFAEISRRLNKELSEPRRFESFVYFFMYRLVMVELKVEQTNTAMVFEVINDRGVKLKPHEILKGKLLGQVSKKELDDLKLNAIWDDQVSKVNDSVNESVNDEIDHFFTYFLKAKCANSSQNGGKYEKNYHRAIFSESKLNLDHNPQGVISFLQNEFTYYTDLYIKILEYCFDESPSNGSPYVHYNYLTGMEMQFLLILSSCALNDTQKNEKIRTVAYELDRLYCLLQLQNSYESYNFTNPIYKLSASIRDEDVSVIRESFDKTLRYLLVQATNREDIQKVLTYPRFKGVGLGPDNKTFVRYFLARIENFIADKTNMGMRHSVKSLVSNKFHVEHILAHDDANANIRLFGDEDKFDSERNRLGGLLLLKGAVNQSSRNEPYSKKLATYANTLYWNETLRADSYKSKPDFTKNLIEKLGLQFRSMNKFGPDELDERHHLLYEMVKLIWE